MSTALQLNPQTTPAVEATHDIPPHVVDCIRQSLQGLKFGQITINIHEGHVVQIDRVARLRQFRSAGRK